MNHKYTISFKEYTAENIQSLIEECSVSRYEHLREVGFFLGQWYDDSAVIICNTSGSTGTPKQIMIAKEMMIASARATSTYFDLADNIRVLHCLPVSFIAGKMMLVRAIIHQWVLDVVPPNTKPLENLDSGYDFAAMIPIQIENSLDKITNIKKIIVGGAAVSRQLSNRIKNLPNQIFETYGMTETVTHIAAKRINGNHPSRAFELLPNITIDTDDRNCLIINDLRVNSKPIITNDIVEIKNSNHFVWRGRVDNVINSGGIKIVPEEIEQIMTEVLDVRFFVTGMEDKKWGQRLVLIVESLDIDVDKLKLSLQKILPQNKVPKQIIQLSAFCDTNNKINRNETIFVYKSLENTMI